MVVRATVTAEVGRTGIERVFTVADGSSRIAVQNTSGVAATARRTEVEVTGKLAAPYGQLEIRPMRVARSPSGRACCTPIDLGSDAAAGEATESRLIVVTGSCRRSRRTLGR